MNTQPRNKILIIIIACLLVSNIVLLTLFLMGKPEKKQDRGRTGMGAYLKSEIGFSDKQLVEFDSIKARHRRDVKSMFDSIKNKKAIAFKAVGAQGFNDSILVRAANEAAEKQERIELVMLQHLRDIRNICTPVQQQKFDTGFYKVMMRPRNEDRNKNEK